MPTSLASGAYNPTLTAYAHGLAPLVRNEDSLFIAPEVVVPAGAGKYKQFDTEDAFRIHNTRRALGGKRNRIDFEATDPTFSTEAHGLEVPLDDQERTHAGDDGELRLEQAKTRLLITNANIERYDRVITLAKTQAAVGGVGVWSGGSNQPVDEIDNEIENLATTCGMMPNKILFGLTAWRIFKNHPNVRSRLPDNIPENASREVASTLLLNPEINIRIQAIPKDTSKKGGTSAKSQIVGDAIFIFLSQDNPTEFDPSWMKIFTRRPGAIEQISQYRDDSSNSDIYHADWEEDLKITGSSCVKRITVT